MKRGLISFDQIINDMALTMIPRYEVLTPDQTGTCTLKTDVEIKDGGAFHASQSLSVDIEVDKDIRTVTGDIMAALRILSVSGKKDKEYLKMAIRHMEDVQKREIVNPPVA
jgi:hypothetical protein